MVETNAWSIWGWFLFRRDSGKRAKQPPVWNPDKQREHWVRLFALKYIPVQIILYIFIVICYLDQCFKTLGWLIKENIADALLWLYSFELFMFAQ